MLKSLLLPGSFITEESGELMFFPFLLCEGILAVYHDFRLPRGTGESGITKGDSGGGLGGPSLYCKSDQVAIETPRSLSQDSGTPSVKKNSTKTMAATAVMILV